MFGNLLLALLCCSAIAVMFTPALVGWGQKRAGRKFGGLNPDADQRLQKWLARYRIIHFRGVGGSEGFALIQGEYARVDVKRIVTPLKAAMSACAAARASGDHVALRRAEAGRDAKVEEIISLHQHGGTKVVTTSKPRHPATV